MTPRFSTMRRIEPARNGASGSVAGGGGQAKFPRVAVPVLEKNCRENRGIEAGGRWASIEECLLRAFLIPIVSE